MHVHIYICFVKIHRAFHILYYMGHTGLSSFGFYNVCSVSWGAFHVDTYRSPTYLLKCYLVFYQTGGFHRLLTCVPDGWLVRFLSLFFACLLACNVRLLQHTASHGCFGEPCVLPSQRRSWEECIEVQGENTFKWKDATELPPRVTRGFSLPPAGHECRVVTSPHPNRLLILSKFLFLSMWLVKTAISLLCSFAFPHYWRGWSSLVPCGPRHGSFLGRNWGTSEGGAVCPSQYSPAPFKPSSTAMVPVRTWKVHY